MIRSIRFACKSTKAGGTITSNAPIPRWQSAICQHRAALHSASSTRITRVQKRRRGDETGGIAAFIELIQRMGGTPDAHAGRASDIAPCPKGPDSDITPKNLGPATAVLFDRLVGAGEDGGRDIEAERIRRLEIDDQLELRRLLNRQVGGLFAF